MSCVLTWEKSIGVLRLVLCSTLFNLGPNQKQQLKLCWTGVLKGPFQPNLHLGGTVSIIGKLVVGSTKCIGSWWPWRIGLGFICQLKGLHQCTVIMLTQQSIATHKAHSILHPFHSIGASSSIAYLHKGIALAPTTPRPIGYKVKT